MTQEKHDPTRDIITQEEESPKYKPLTINVPQDVDTSDLEASIFPEAHQWVKAGAEANPGIVFQAVVGGQLITSETPQSTRELWCDEIPPVWEVEHYA